MIKSNSEDRFLVYRSALNGGVRTRNKVNKPYIDMNFNKNW